MFAALKRTGKDVIIYGVGQGLTSAAAFLLVPLYTRHFPQSDFGKLGLLASVNAVAVIAISMGLNSAIFRSYYDYDDVKGQRAVVNTTLILMVFIALVVSLLCLPLIPILSKTLFNETRSTVLIWLIVLKAVAFSFRGVPLAIYRARGQAMKYVAITFAAVLLKLSVIIYLVVVGGQGLMGAIAGDAATAVIATLVMLWTIRKDMALVFSWSEVRKLLAFGFPLVPADLASMVFTRADLFFLNEYTDLSTVGQYNAAVIIITAIQMLVKTPFMLVWTPMVLSVEKEKFANKFYARVTTYLLTIMGFLTLGISLFANEVIQIVAGPGYEAAARVLPILCLAQVFYIVQISFSMGITLKRKTQYIPVILSGVALTTLVANFLLVPRFGILGAGFAGLLSSIVFAILTYLVSQRIYYVKHDWIRAVKFVVVMLLVYVVAIIIGTFIPAWLFGGIRVLALPLSLFLLLAWHFLKKDEIETVKRQLTLLDERISLLVRGR